MDKSSILINKPVGYIYKISIPTSNGIRYYIGKRESPKLDTKYWGSGIKIQKWIQKHTNFKYKSYNLPNNIASELGLIREVLYWAFSKKDLLIAEYKYTINILNNQLYWNLRAGGDKLGISEETRQKMSKAHVGKSGWNKGLTKETDDRVRIKAEKQKGIPLSEDHKKALRKPKKVKSFKKDKTYEEIYGEKKAKQLKQLFSEQRKGKKQSEELKRKRAASLKGHIVSDITKKKLYLANIGKKHSIETRLKMKLAVTGRKWWNNGKENKQSKVCPGKNWIQGRINYKVSNRNASKLKLKYTNITCLETNEVFYCIFDIIKKYPYLKHKGIIKSINSHNAYKNLHFIIFNTTFNKF